MNEPGRHLKMRNDRLGLHLYSHSLSLVPSGIPRVHRAAHNSARTAKPEGRSIDVDSGEEGEEEEEKRNPGESF